MGFSFILAEHCAQIDDTASIQSLRIGLKAYFSTYAAAKFVLAEYGMDNIDIVNKKTLAEQKYVECVINIAIHIHHFFELEIKKMLYSAHPLYAADAKEDMVLLNKLITASEVSSEEMDKLKQVEFSTALERLIKLQKSGILTDAKTQIIVENRELLKSLNTLRNRVLHRGKCVIMYGSLDLLFARYVLPFIKKILDFSCYEDIREIVLRNRIYEIIDEIISEGMNEAISYRKIAVLKERARVEYQHYDNNYRWFDNFGWDIESKMEYLAEQVIPDMKCPCCGNISMVQEREFAGLDTDELGEEMRGVVRTIKIPYYHYYRRCVMCEFTVEKSLLE